MSIEIDITEITSRIKNKQDAREFCSKNGNIYKYK